MRFVVSGRSLQRLAACIIGLSIIGAVAAPATSPARGDGTTSVAVVTFQNEAGTGGNVAEDLSNAAYRGVSATSGFVTRGGGPLAYPKSLTDDPMIDALAEAAKAGADDMLIGSVIQTGGGQAYYRLTLYRVAPMAFISSQVFSQPYPSGNSAALAAGFASNLAALTATRTATGTIYSTTDGPVADVGSEAGFQMGDKFAVTRNGQRMADATITSIREDDATLTISNAVPGYQPQVGDSLVGSRAMGAVPPAPAQKSGFNPLALLAVAGAALLAIGHHGQPGAFCSSCVAPSPSATSFVISSFAKNGEPPSGTFTFTFSQPVNSTSQTGIAGSQTYAYFVLQPIGSNATTPPAPLSQFGNTSFDPTGTIMTLGMQGSGLVQGEMYEISFTSSVTSTAGASLIAETTGLQTLDRIFHKSLTVKPKVGPVAPGPAAPGGKPGVPKVPPGGPKPPPNKPPIPH